VPLLQEVLRANPNQAEADRELGYAYRLAGLLTQSIESAKHARRLDPRLGLDGSAVEAYLYLGQYDDFVAELPAQEANASIEFFRGFAEYHLGRTADAIRDLDRAFELDASLLQTQAGKALSYKLKNDPQKGIALLQEVSAPLIQRGARDAEGLYKIAQAYAQLGDKTAALGMLDASVDGGFFPYPYLLKDPLLASIRSGADYAQIMDKARLRYTKFKARFAPGAPAVN
jgi:tetratricopeptide (TPR) repeat protein